MKKYLFSILLFTAITSHAANKDERVVYGDDNRKEIFEVSSFWKKKANSTVALVQSKMIKDNGDGTITLTTKNYGKTKNLCADEPFVNQPVAGFCSGALVGKNLVMTAGHCISNWDCKKTNFVFGFGYDAPNQNLSVLKKSDVYTCKKILAKTYTNKADFAIVELDRDVTGYSPLAIRREGAIKANDNLVVIGNPQGIPTKVAADSKVREVKDEFFVANLDTYQGNSGSAVFNENTGLIEGILVRGETDFVKVNGCYKSNVCPETGCRGEDVTRVDTFLQYIPE